MSFQIRTDDVIAISGKRRSGKSYFLKKFLIPRLPSAVIWDYNHEYQLRNSTVLYGDPNLILKNIAKTKYIIFRPTSKTEEDFESFCQICNRLTNTFIVVEEVERYETSWHVTPQFKMLIDTGRHKGLGLICTMRRTKRVTIDVLFNADFIFAFRQHTPQDLDYLAEFMNPQVVYKLLKLPEYWFIVYDDRQGTTTVYSKV